MSFSLFGRSGRGLRLAVPLAIGLATSMTALPVLADSASAPVILVAQNDANAAQLTLRIQALEQQMRDLTGQVQGLQFQVTQLQTLIDRSNQDDDFRFKQLENAKGGGPGKNSAAGLSGSVTQPEIAPQNPSMNSQSSDGRQLASSDAGQGGGDDLGASMDPLVGKGGPDTSRQAEEVPLGPSRGAGVAANPAARARTPEQPTMLASTGGAAADPAAAALYKRGYDAIVKGDYTTATDQFRAFLKRYPDDAQAADATNWLGEALLQQQNYVDAADVLVTGYKSYPNSLRAPDMLLKLGIALAGAKQPDAACKTFGLLATKYPNTTTAFKTRLRQEMARGKCSA
ncbi:MAG TPA: tol-pal system protein YbgF [Devosiaceae bacterium]|nr:tol-pal system protein YbgF [Devosiaceae bacterium]